MRVSGSAVSSSTQWRGDVAGILIVLAGALASGCASGETGPSGLPPEVDEVDEVTARYERRFMEGMILHHRMAVEMSATCADRAAHEELRALCRVMGGAQQREIDDMTGWLQEWYQAAPPEEARMSDDQRRSMNELGSLSGAAFDAEFMDDMIVHHTVATADASTCANLAIHEPLIELCDNIIDAQLAEVDQMQSWQREWFTTGGPQPP